MKGASIENYTPRDIDADTWNIIRDFCVTHGTTYHTAFPDGARKFMGHLTRLAAFAHSTGYELEPEYVFDIDVINMCVDDAKDRLSRSTLSTMRTTLIRIAEVCHPKWNGAVQYIRHPRSAPSEPYKRWELISINDWTTHPSDFVAGERDKNVALGLGAGLSAAEMVALTWGRRVPRCRRSDRYCGRARGTDGCPLRSDPACMASRRC